jgi:hypothetical protein
MRLDCEAISVDATLGVSVEITKVHLAPGEIRQVQLVVAARQLAYYDG